MARRIGAFKAGGAQLIIWERDSDITFQFGKHYQDKQTQEWKESKIIYARELQGIGEMFLRAADWARKKVKTEPLPQNVERVKTTLETITKKMEEKNG